MCWTAGLLLLDIDGFEYDTNLVAAILEEVLLGVGHHSTKCMDTKRCRAILHLWGCLLTVSNLY